MSGQIRDLPSRSQEPRLSEFGRLLRHHRQAAGLTQEALAERAQISTNAIGALERGYRATPQRETLALLVTALKLSDDELLAFEAAAARPKHRRARTSVAVGPWPKPNASALPLALTSFVGRGVELFEIERLVREHRLVTLTGPGGIGKTQTALQIGRALSESAEGTVCFVELAPVDTPLLVVRAIATALGVQEGPHHSLLDTLLTYLRNKALLLILDNCEHVVAEAAIAAESLLAACPRIRVLATSRAVLRAAGEHTYRLLSLNLTDAMKLFRDRARAIGHCFTVSDETRPIVAELCRHLDGIPMAIELAAARTNILSLKELTEKLDERLCILGGGPLTVPPRQRTMCATIDWSYSLLTAAEKRVFKCLSVFPGGWTLAAAVAACSEDNVADDEVLELLSSLVDKSLLEADFRENEPRYRLLEPFRQYALQKLKASCEGGAAILRNIEMIFGLKPLTCLDANAPPIVFPFQQSSDTRPYATLLKPHPTRPPQFGYQNPA